MLVPSYDWAAMFAPHFRKLKHIKSYHHFYFDSSTPGVVHFKAASDSKEERIVLQKNTVWCPTSSDVPERVTPAGLSLERQWYLYNTIAEYCPEAVRDKVCPKPLVAFNTALQQHDSTTLTSTATNSTDHLSTIPTTSTPVSPSAVSSTSGLTAPPTKKARLCTKCKQPGHNGRSCGKGSS